MGEKENLVGYPNKISLGGSYVYKKVAQWYYTNGNCHCSGCPRRQCFIFNCFGYFSCWNDGVVPSDKIE
jgi:hypothetical protein